MKVEIYRLKAGGGQDAVATCRLVENEVVFEGDPGVVETLRQGVVDASVRPPKRVSPEAGRMFLEALSENLHTGYLEASGIIYDSQEPQP